MWKCRKKNRATQLTPKVNQLNSTPVKQEGDQHFSTNTMELYHLDLPREAPICIQLAIDNQLVEMEVDTGASVTVMSEELFRAKFNNPITLVSQQLRIYSGEVIKPDGVVEVTVKYKSQMVDLPLVITPNNGPTLLGRNRVRKIVLDWKSLIHLDSHAIHGLG